MSDTLNPLHSILSKHHHPHHPANNHHHLHHHESHVIGQIERSLEEGQETGQLVLSAQQIKAYPSKLAANFDLSDVVAVDLSKNRLVEIDVSICNFYCLQSLNVYNNLIKSIPCQITNLQFLKVLNLSRNQLTVFPLTVCQLSRLRVSRFACDGPN